MIKSLIKECVSSKEILMRSAIWNSIKIFAQILLRISITIIVYWSYRLHNWSTV